MNDWVATDQGICRRRLRRCCEGGRASGSFVSIGEWMWSIEEGWFGVSALSPVGAELSASRWNVSHSCSTRCLPPSSRLLMQ